MTPEEIKLRRLAGQHLLAPADTQAVVKGLCGVQAQFLSHAFHEGRTHFLPGFFITPRSCRPQILRPWR